MEPTASRAGLRLLRAAWIASHLFWTAALMIAIDVGRRARRDPVEASLCDEAAFSNGNNGPFGYGAHAVATTTIECLLFGGAAAATILTIWSTRRRADELVVANLLLGVIGGAIAAVTFVRMSEHNPFCPDGAWHAPVGVAASLLVAALILNLVLNRSFSGHERHIEDRILNDS